MCRFPSWCSKMACPSYLKFLTWEIWLQGLYLAEEYKAFVLILVLLPSMLLWVRRVPHTPRRISINVPQWSSSGKLFMKAPVLHECGKANRLTWRLQFHNIQRAIPWYRRRWCASPQRAAVLPENLCFVLPSCWCIKRFTSPKNLLVSQEYKHTHYQAGGRETIQRQHRNARLPSVCLC